MFAAAAVASSVACWQQAGAAVVIQLQQLQLSTAYQVLIDVLVLQSQSAHQV
jgi:hypothetical protein